MIVPAFVFGETALAEIVRCCPGVATVIAVDDASDPPVSAVAGARVLRLRTNAGPAVARNAGLGAVATPLVAFVDTDVRLVPGWLDRLLLPLRRRPGRPRRATRRQRPGAGAVAGYEQGHSPLDLGPEPGRIAAGHAAELRAGGGDPRAHGRAPARSTGSSDRCAAARTSTPCGASVEAGWRCRYEPASVVHHRPRGSWRGARRPARRLRLVGRAAGRAPPRRARPRPCQRLERRRVGLLAAGHPVLGDRRRRRHVGRPRAQAAAACRRPSRCASPGWATCTPDGCSPTPARRAWWPFLLAGAVVSRECAGRRRPRRRAGAPRRRRAAARRRPRLRRRAVEGRPRRTPAGPAPAGASRRGRGAPPTPERPGWTVRRRRDAPPHRRHRGVAARTSTRSPATAPGLVPVVKGNGYGFGRAELAAVAAGFADTIAVGTVHELDHVPAGVTPVVLTPSGGRRPTASRSSPSAPWSTSTPSPVGRAGCSSSWSRRCAASARPSTTSARSARAARAAGLDVVGFSIHPPWPAPTTSTPTTSPRGSTSCEPDDEVWVSHLSAEGYADLRDGWPERRFRIRLGTGAVARRQARPPPRRRRARRAARSAPASTPATASSVVPADGRLVMVGAGTAHGVHPLADGRSPFHFARRRLALLEPPHMHTSMLVRAGRADRRPVGRRRRRAAPADLDAYPDEVRWQ